METKNANQNQDDLEKELLAEDETFNPADSTNWKAVLLESEYPEQQEIWRGSKPAFKALDTHINLAFLLNKFGARFRYNLMTRKREIDIPGLMIFHDDPDNNLLAQVEYLATINHLQYRQIDKFLDILCADNAYHPIIECIKDHPWDGVARLDNFINTIQTKDEELKKILIRTWMVAAIAAAHSIDGFTNHGMLVLQGLQGVGKTAWVKKLDPCNCGAVKEGALLDPTNKDNVISLSRFWIIELGEIDATFNKTDIARLKSYITSQSDYVRHHYARKDTILPRRSICLATVNESNFLVDTTGNRRFWTLEVTDINYGHKIDMKQVWAEVYAIWQAGALTYLPKDIENAVNKSNLKHEKIDPFEEKLLTFYDWEHSSRRTMTCVAVLEDIGYSKPTQAEAIRMGKILTKLNGKPSLRSNGLSLHEIPCRRNIP